MSDIDCKGTSVLICPHCGKDQQLENYELSDYEDNQECRYCNGVFEYERETVALYTSKKR